MVDYQDILFFSILAVLWFAVSFRWGYRRGYKKKVESAERLRFRFRALLFDVERNLAAKNNPTRSELHNKLDQEIMKIKQIKKELDSF